jgi:hypothetical protein
MDLYVQALLLGVQIFPGHWQRSVGDCHGGSDSSLLVMLLLILRSRLGSLEAARHSKDRVPCACGGPSDRLLR